MKGSVNKGFFSYLILFFCLILGVILICFTIMIFSPGTSIFGWIYVRDNVEYKIETYNGKDFSVIVDENGEVVNANEKPNYFDFNNLSSISIKCVDASINIIHGDYDQIIVNNKIKGFMKKADRVELSITKYYNPADNSLAITIIDKNPKLTISNNKSVDLHLKENGSHALLNLNFEITGKGGVDIGSKAFNSNAIRQETFNSLNVVTNVGDVLISKNDVFSSSVKIKTVTGNIECKEDLNFNSKTTDFKLISFETQKGKIKANNLSADDSITFTAEESYVNVGKLKSDVVVCHIANGDFRTNDIEGKLIDNDDVVRNTNFVIGNISGDVTIPNATKSGFKAGEISGTALISTQSGAISIKSLKGRGEITSTSGSIDILIDENNYGEIKLSTENGAVNARFLSVLGSNLITTSSGKINIEYKEGLEFKLTAKTTKNISLKNENIQRNNEEIIGYPSIIDNPIQTSNTLTLTSNNGDIEIFRSSNVG